MFDLPRDMMNITILAMHWKRVFKGKWINKMLPSTTLCSLKPTSALSPFPNKALSELAHVKNINMACLLRDRNLLGNLQFQLQLSSCMKMHELLMHHEVSLPTPHQPRPCSPNIPMRHHPRWPKHQQKRPVSPWPTGCADPMEILGFSHRKPWENLSIYLHQFLKPPQKCSGTRLTDELTSRWVQQPTIHLWGGRCSLKQSFHLKFSNTNISIHVRTNNYKHTNEQNIRD